MNTLLGTQWIFCTLVQLIDFYLTEACWVTQSAVGLSTFQKFVVLPLELQGGSSASSSSAFKPFLTLTQDWGSQRVFKSQSFRTQNTFFFFSVRNARDGCFPRTAHKSLLFHNVSERVHPHVLREEWCSVNKSPLPPSLDVSKCFLLAVDAATWASLWRKGNIVLSEGYISLELSLI